MDSEKKIISYDPMTGAPIYAEETAESTAKMSMGANQQNTVSPSDDADDKKKKSKKKKWFLIIGAALMVILAIFGGIAYAGIQTGILLSKPDKVLMATKNTFEEEDLILKSLSQPLKMLEDGSYTLTGYGNIEGQVGKVNIIQTSSGCEINGSVDLSGMPELNATIVASKGAIKAQTSITGDLLFVYDYENIDKNGYLARSAGVENLEVLNESLLQAENPSKAKKISKLIEKAVLKEFRSWDFEKTKKEKFKINDKRVSATGYQVTINQGMLKDMLEAIGDAYEDGYGDEMGRNMKQSLQMLESEIYGMPEIEMTFYIRLGKLAAIKAESMGQTVEVCFKGGETCWQNTEVYANNEMIACLNGKTDGKKEFLQVIVDSETIAEITYSPKDDGKFDVRILADEAKLVVKGKLESSASHLELQITDMKMEGFSPDVDMSLTIEKGGKLSKLKGDEFDINSASEADYEELAEKYFWELSGLANLF